MKYVTMNNNCVIVVPVYSEKPTASEEASFVQLLRVLGNHQIRIVTHRKLDTKRYSELANANGFILQYEYFEANYFESVNSYNQLCLSTEFYSRFTYYDFMLIYQLDAWVFRDELDYWCQKGFDYIGAPLFWCISANNFSTDVFGVGNGGFSLRRIQYCLNLINHKRCGSYYRKGYFFWYYKNICKYNVRFHSVLKRIAAMGFSLVQELGYHNTYKYIIKKTTVGEDQLFGISSGWIKGFASPNVAPLEEAVKFAFDTHPSMLFEYNNNNLPFGCHAYEKWEYDSFWKKYIPESGTMRQIEM